MKKSLISLLTTFSLLLPVTAQAYFIDFFDNAKNYQPGYVQDPSLDFLPGWPDWIGRLNVFSKYLYGKRYQNLTAEQRMKVEALSKNWPDWIGVPLYLR